MTDTTASPEPKKNRQWIRQAVDFGALAAFMISYFVSRDMILATWVLVGASGLALIIGLFALVFGLLTVLTHDDLYVKLKLTVQNGLLAVILLGSIPLKKYPFKALLGSAIKVNDAAWRTLTLRYGLYFLAVAILNEIFRSPAAVTALWHALGRDTPNPNDVWTSFRGVLWIAASIFGLSQVPLIMKNMTKDEEPGPISPDTGM